MQTKNPYGMGGLAVKTAPETVTSTNAKASGKAKARYPHTPLGPGQDNPTTGKMGRRAYTPGTTPAGS